VTNRNCNRPNGCTCRTGEDSRFCPFSTDVKPRSTIDHNLYNASEEEAALATFRRDYADLWGPLCRACDIPLAAVRKEPPQVVVSMILIRLQQRFDRELLHLRARCARLEKQLGMKE